jgi:Flp pilus assembly protein TadD
MGAFLGLVKFDFQYDSTVADRYAYLGMLGVAMAVAFAVQARPSGGVLVSAALVVLVFAARSFAHAGVWSDSRSLFEATLTANPDSYVAHNVLGYLDAREGRLDSAIAHDRAALRTQPNDATAHYNLGNALVARADAAGAAGATGNHAALEEAVDHYRRAAACAIIATPLSPRNAMIRNNLAATLARLGRFQEAERSYRDALDLDPNLDIARRGLERVRKEKRD